MEMIVRKMYCVVGGRFLNLLQEMSKNIVCVRNVKNKLNCIKIKVVIL
jgi:hypothetical protein